MICGAAILLHCALAGAAYQVSEPSGERTVTVTTKPISFGKSTGDVVVGSGKVDSPPGNFRPSKRLLNHVVLPPEYQEYSRQSDGVYDDVGVMRAIQQQLQHTTPVRMFDNSAIQPQLQFKTQVHLLENGMYVLPSQALTYDFNHPAELESGSDSASESAEYSSSAEKGELNFYKHSWHFPDWLDSIV